MYFLSLFSRGQNCSKPVAVNINAFPDQIQGRRCRSDESQAVCTVPSHIEFGGSAFFSL